MKDKRAQEQTAKRLPAKGEMEYLAALKRGALETELNDIVTRHLPGK